MLRALFASSRGHSCMSVNSFFRNTEYLLSPELPRASAAYILTPHSSSSNDSIIWLYALFPPILPRACTIPLRTYLCLLFILLQRKSTSLFFTSNSTTASLTNELSVLRFRINFSLDIFVVQWYLVAEHEFTICFSYKWNGYACVKIFIC